MAPWKNQRTGRECWRRWFVVFTLLPLLQASSHPHTASYGLIWLLLCPSNPSGLASPARLLIPGVMTAEGVDAAKHYLSVTALWVKDYYYCFF